MNKLSMRSEAMSIIIPPFVSSERIPNRLEVRTGVSHKGYAVLTSADSVDQHPRPKAKPRRHDVHEAFVHFVRAEEIACFANRW